MARFVANLRYADTPSDVRHRAALLILDVLGSGLYACELEWSRLLRGTLTAMDATREGVLWGTSYHLSRVPAVLCDGPRYKASSWITCTTKP